MALGLTVLFLAVGRSTAAQIPEAHFCRFDCSSSGRPSRPGSCFRAAEVWDTQGVDWLTLRLRDESMEAAPRFVLPEWAELLNGNMTWEGWFRMTSPPATVNTLMGTYGANHDYLASESSPRVSYDDSISNRRRYAAVAVDPSGRLSLTSNVGATSGTVTHDISLADGEWHHVAATFLGSGGAQLAFGFRVVRIMSSKLFNRPTILAAFQSTLKEMCAELAGSETLVEDTMVAVYDALIKPTPVVWEYAVAVRCEINTRPDLVDAKVAELTSRNRTAEAALARVKAVTDIGVVLQQDYFVEDIEVREEEVETVDVGDAGTMQLFVDGFPATKGWVNYANRSENLGMDGELVLCGGRLGRAMGCQMSRFRMWNQAIPPEQLRALWPCTPPSFAEVVGGAPPHGLVYSGELAGALGNGAPGSALPALAPGLRFEAEVVRIEDWDPPAVVGKFVHGGRCHYDRCPDVSPSSRVGGPGCRLVPGSQIAFFSADTCEEHAALSFCRLAGSSRGRPANEALDGCHVGGSIASRGRPLSWRVLNVTEEM